ncbi:hypothetical protein MycrhDRAFT_2414 [Mycolicibacterium rhodesiae JS60]|nr:hypothetical protein MycrhDRAFT_2414 [Mycolicibacterium rhodesiae JS60]
MPGSRYFGTTAGMAVAVLAGAGLLTTALDLSSTPAIELSDFSVSASPTSVPWWLDADSVLGSGLDTSKLSVPKVGAAAIGNSCGLVCNGADGTSANPNGQNGACSSATAETASVAGTAATQGGWEAMGATAATH